MEYAPKYGQEQLYDKLSANSWLWLNTCVHIHTQYIGSHMQCVCMDNLYAEKITEVYREFTKTIV